MWTINAHVCRNAKRTLFEYKELVSTQTTITAENQSYYIRNWRLETAWGDIMHDLFAGIARDHCASTKVELVEFGLVLDAYGNKFASDAEAYAALSIEFKIYCRKHCIKRIALRFSKATLGREHKTDYPGLANSIKCANVKAIVGFCAHIAKYELAMIIRQWHV